jgi:hypothetical protein
MQGFGRRAPKLYDTLITVKVIDVTDTKRDTVYLFLRFNYDLLGIDKRLLPANHAITPENTSFYMNKGWCRERYVDLHLPPVDTTEAHRPLTGTCAETRDDYSEEGNLCSQQGSVRIGALCLSRFIVS